MGLLGICAGARRIYITGQWCKGEGNTFWLIHSIVSFKYTQRYVRVSIKISVNLTRTSKSSDAYSIHVVPESQAQCGRRGERLQGRARNGQTECKHRVTLLQWLTWLTAFTFNTGQSPIVIFDNKSKNVATFVFHVQVFQSNFQPFFLLMLGPSRSTCTLLGQHNLHYRVCNKPNHVKNPASL